MLIARIKGWFLVSAGMLMLLAGCGNDTTNTEYVQKSAPASTYLVEYIPGMMPAAEGKTTFQIRVRKRSDSSAATGLSLTLIPLMHMTGMTHSTPVDVITESPAGTYNCTAYYLMASGMGMGYWELQVNIGTETATFYPSVGMAMMGSDTTKVSLYGPSDIVSSMSGTQYNYYYLFNDGVVSAATPTVKLYLSHALDMRMTFMPVSAVSSPTGTVSSVVVTASTDTAFSSPVVASDDGNGHYSMPISTLSTTGTYTVYVKLQVNGEDKTTNGAAATGANAYQSFKITSH
jgi:hypothetical protein